MNMIVVEDDNDVEIPEYNTEDVNTSLLLKSCFNSTCTAKSVIIN